MSKKEHPWYSQTMTLEVLQQATNVIMALNALPRVDRVEVDDVPIRWHDQTVGFVVISELDGRYEYAPLDPKYV